MANNKFDGKIKSHQPAAYASEISQYLNTQYPIRMQSQCLTTNDLDDVVNTLDNYISQIDSALDSFITCCDNAKANCDTEAFDIIYNDGDTLNHIPDNLDTLIKDATSIRQTFSTFSQKIIDFANNARNKDTKSYSAWVAYQEHLKAQEQAQASENTTTVNS